MGQHRRRHHDRLVARKRPDHRDRRAGDRRQPLGEFGARLLLDLHGKAGNDVVEQVDLIVGIIVRPKHEEVGDPA
jgi:hypothetical protein